MPALTNLPNHLNLGAALLNEIGAGMPKLQRPLEYFGAKAVALSGETLIDNRLALLDAIEWSSNTGGALIQGAGRYGVDGDLTMTPFLSWYGSGKGSFLQQLSTTDGLVMLKSPTVAEGGTAFVTLDNFVIHGGWGVNWTLGAGEVNNVLVHLETTANGCTHPLIQANTGRDATTDCYSMITRMHFADTAGTGLILSGRGENRVVMCNFDRMGVNGMRFDAPDNWSIFNSMFAIGDSAFKITSGNHRLIGDKLWFTGKRRDVEPVGAGLELDGAGNQNVIATGYSMQDNYGPGLHAEGDGLIFDGQIDESGGGRIEHQDGAWDGPRSKPRAFLRIGNLKGSSIRASVAGGRPKTSVFDPYLVDFDGDGADQNIVDLFCRNAHLDPGVIRQPSGYASAKRHNTIRANGRLIHGVRTEAEILDATHSVNAYGPGYDVQLDDGRRAFKMTDGTWGVSPAVTVMTPV